MATTQKTSSKSTSSSKRSRSAHAKPTELAGHAQMIGEMRLVLDELVRTGMLATARSQRSPRTPLPEYAKVVAIGPADEVAEVRGRTGVVLDAQNSGGEWTYTVYFPTMQETFVLNGQGLWDTGQTVPEDVIYGGGKTLRVRVDRDGKGTLVV
jgi:hypothetical protein